MAQSKIGIIIAREFNERVRKKSFIVTTILMPILMIGLIVLIISQIVLAFVQVDGMTKIVCAIGLILFAGMTIYDAQSTRALLTEYEAQGPEMVKKISILCALNLYLDFVNMFLYILQLLGNRD